MNTVTTFPMDLRADHDRDLAQLDAAKDIWAQTPVARRIALLAQIKDRLMEVADKWVAAAGRAKGIPEGSALLGEEWISGPYAVMSCCNGLMSTLSHMQGKAFLKKLPARRLPNGQTAVRIIPHSIWDHLLISGVKADVWMQAGVTPENLATHTAGSYDTPEAARRGKVALVLGAGNIAAITPLDVFQKLFSEHQVVMLKMNPINDYLTPFLEHALKPLIDVDALRIHKGDGMAGAYLCEHPLVGEIHITGARGTHDAIVWGIGKEGAANKAAGTPRNKRPITSELGAVCPTIVVPGPWTAADLRFQAENIATKKLHNSGHNCVAVQSLILPKGWDKNERLMANVASVMQRFANRPAHYPGSEARMAEFRKNATNVQSLSRGAAPACLVTDMAVGDTTWLKENEVFAPAMGVMHLDAPDAETYLRKAIAWANDNLDGTLGGNILIHPATIRAMGRVRFQEIIADFRYGAVAINAWSGLAFLATACPWGGYAGATLNDVQSGLGFVHNTFMFDKVERVVIEAPWRPFPRNLLSGRMTLLPRPPWFVSNTQQHHVGKLLTRFQWRPSVLRLPRIFFHALLG